MSQSASKDAPVPLCGVSPAEANLASAGREELQSTRWFKEKIEPHEPVLRAYLRGRFSSLVDIDDLVQDTYARLLRMRETGTATLTRAYLFVVARNAALDQVRRNRVVTVEPLADTRAQSIVEEGTDVADTVSREEELRLLADAIRALPARCREIVTLRRMEGLPYEVIARRLRISESTVHAQLAIGLKRCRQYLCDHGVAKACLHVSKNSTPSA